MPTYIISSHGDPQWNSQATVPANTSVLFYQRFGTPMPNATGLLLQTALVRPNEPLSAQVLRQHPSVALWNGPTRQTPEIDLTGDNQNFYTGVVCADTNTVILPIGRNQLVTLSYALGQITRHAGGAQAVVHCLFCL